jgi:hypothetical protein
MQPSGSRVRLIALGLLLFSAVGCGGSGDDAATSAPRGRIVEEILGSNALISNALISNALISNALISNALISNALISNALISNALISNALISNALRSDGFTEGALSRQFLSYLYSCAMPLGSKINVSINGTDYGTYEGALGIAPEWGTEGGKCDEHCQRWVTACLLARTNFWGVPVKISLRGDKAGLTPDTDEKKRFPLREGAYFGNLFGPNGVNNLHACAGPGSNIPQLTNRFCSGAQGVCAIQVSYDCVKPADPATLPSSQGLAQLIPTRFACLREDPNEGNVRNCFTGGVSITGNDPHGDSYDEAITVYLQAPVALCGDGVCTGDETPASCPHDCSTGWAVSYPGVDNVPDGLALLPGGDAILGVTAFTNTDLGTGPIKVVGGDAGRVIARIAPDGHTVWAKQIVYGALQPFFFFSLSGSNDPVFDGVALDKSGNIFTTGLVNGVSWFEDVPYGPAPVTDPLQAELGFPTFYIEKLDPSGAKIWLQRFRGIQSGFVVTPEGQAVVVALELVEFSPQFFFPAFVARILDATTGESTPTVVGVFNPDGPSSLPTVYEAEGGGEFIAPALQGGFGRVNFVKGTVQLFDPMVDATNSSLKIVSTSHAPNGDIVALAEGPILGRYTHEGRLLWQKPLTSTAVVSQGVRVDPAGDIMVYGPLRTPIDFENDVLAPTGYTTTATNPPRDVWIAKYDSDGKKRWVRKIGGGGDDLAVDGEIASDGRIWVTGGFAQTGVFDGHILYNATGGGDSSTWETFLVSIPDPL